MESVSTFACSRLSRVVWLPRLLKLVDVAAPWKIFTFEQFAIEFVSGNGSEERDDSPPPEDSNEIYPKKAGKFWVYEQAVKIPYYAIYEESKASVEVYHLVNGRYQLIKPNDRGHYSIPQMGVELGIQFGKEETPIPWLRFWDADGNLLLTGDERAVVEMQARLQAEAAGRILQGIADRANLIAEQERNEKIQERLAKEQAEAIAEQANLEKQQAEQKAQRLAERLRSLGINPDEM
jgi:hypothetical protein